MWSKNEDGLILALWNYTTKNIWMKTQIHSLTAGGAYGQQQYSISLLTAVNKAPLCL